MLLMLLLGYHNSDNIMDCVLSYIQHEWDAMLAEPHEATLQRGSNTPRQWVESHPDQQPVFYSTSVR